MLTETRLQRLASRPLDSMTICFTMSSVFAANPLRDRARRPRVVKFNRPAERFCAPPLLLSPITAVKNNSKWIYKCPTLRFLDEHLPTQLFSKHPLSLWMDFLSFQNPSPKLCPLSSSWLRNEPDATHIFNLFLFCSLQRRLLRSPGVPLCHFDTLSMRLSRARMNVSHIGKYSPNPQAAGVSSKNFHSIAKVVSPAIRAFIYYLWFWYRLSFNSAITHKKMWDCEAISKGPAV